MNQLTSLDQAICEGFKRPTVESYNTRLRSRSGRKFRNPDFVYEEALQCNSDVEGPKYPEEEEENIRRRSSSWSGSLKAAVVERKVKRKGKQSVRSNQETETVTPNTQISKSDAKNKFKEKQLQLSQQRLDLWFPANTGVADNRNQQLNPSASVNHIKANAAAREDNFLVKYGSDYDSIVNTANAGYLNDSDSNLNSTTSVVTAMAGQGKNPEAGEKGKIYEDEWRTALENMKVELQGSIDNVRSDLTESINSLKTKKETLQRDLKDAQRQLKVCQLQLNEVSGVSVKQDQQLSECQAAIEVLKEKVDRPTLKITGIIESKKENCSELVKSFFKDTMKISSDIPLIDAYRVGKGTNRLMVVQLANPRDKGKIFAKGKNLKDVRNREDKPYNVFDQLSGRKRAEKDRNRHLFAANNAMDAKDQLSMTLEKGTLTVDGKKYEKEIKAPSCREILQASKELRLARLNAHVQRGETIAVEGQEFVGYTTVVKTLKDVNLAYGKVRAMHADARHVVCSCRLPSRNFHTHQDFCDDDEHSGGQFLLQLLEASEIMNRAIFVVRYYDGTHIGPSRFRAMRDAVASAIDKSSHNKVTGQFDTIWMDDSNEIQPRSFRFTFGKVNIRGNSRGRRHGAGWDRDASQHKNNNMNEQVRDNHFGNGLWSDAVKNTPDTPGGNPATVQADEVPEVRV